MDLIFSHVSFAYDGSPDDVVSDLDAHFPKGWTGVVGANGAGKSTVLQLATGLLTPTAGAVRGAGVVRRGRPPSPPEVGSAATYCAQRTDDAPPGLDDLLAHPGAGGAVLRRRLRLGDDWAIRWASLSHGERKRAQLAVALWREPAVLAVDEPTNHLDADARDLVAGALAGYRGVGILVSHDRELLDRLCTQCLFVEPGRAVVRSGGYSAATAQRDAERDAIRRERDQADAELRRLRRVQVTRRNAADRAKAKRSGRHLARHDSDGRGRLRLAVFTGKDGQAGRVLKQLERRVDRARERAASLRPDKVERHGIWMPGARSPRSEVAGLPAGDLSLGGARRLAHPALSVGPADRIAVTGPNGAGKTTLVRRLIRDLTFARERLVYVPQEMTAEESAELLTHVLRMDDGELGRLMTAVSRLGSPPSRLLGSRLPSPGEARKLLLAAGIMREPHLVIMDEPTNHLDLPAIECLEEALADAPCALLLVSHDRRFLQRVCTVEWRLTRASAEDDTGVTVLGLRRDA